MSFHDIIVTGLIPLSILCIILVIFFERKNPSSTIAWVLVLAFLPGLGFLAYLLLGSGFHIRKKKKYAVKAAYDDAYQELFLRHLKLRGRTESRVRTARSRMQHYFDNEGEGRYSEGNNAEVFIDGQSFFSRMLKDIEAAENHVHILYYIFKNDGIGKRLTELLTRKAAEGVEVRVVYDSVGALLSSDSRFDALRKAGGETGIFSPVFFSLSSQLRLNYRNHRKVTVVDGKIGYVGGMNIGDEYLNRDKKCYPWRDTQVRLTGPSVWFLQERFLLDWLYVKEASLEREQMEAFFPKPLEEGGKGVQIVSSGPDTSGSPLKSGFLSMLYGARSSVWMQTPYFTPDDCFLEAMRIAAASGIDVRLMISRITDNIPVQAATLSFAWQMLDCGVRVFLYDGFLHSKTMVFDREALTVGSANLDNRSFTQNFEVNAFIYDRDFVTRYRNIFLADQRRCVELDAVWFERRNVLKRAFSRICRLFAPLM